MRERSEIRFRAIGARDLKFLYRVYASTRADEMALVDWTEAEKTAFLRMQFEAQHKYYAEHFPEARFDLILEGNRRIGRLYVDRRPDEIRIIDIALLLEHRNAGIGARLLRDLLDEAAHAGKPVRIHVEQLNPAMALYRRLGFTEVEERGVYWLMEWQPGEAGVR